MEALDPKLPAQLLRYDAETGDLFWLPRPVEMFKSPGDAKRWHSNFCGKPALTAINGCGYRTGSIFEKVYKAHRVIWAIVHGIWPEGQVDHINGVRSDNRLVNLRDVTISTNQRNAKMQSNNTSGVTGVSYFAARKKWRADIKIGNKYKFLGMFDTIEEATAARVEAQRQHGFSERHGLKAA